MKTKSIFIFMCKCLVALIGVALLLFLLLLAFLSITEYKPADTEKLEILHSERIQKKLNSEQSIRVLSWNLGYGALGAKQDFFMDHGTMVRPKTKAEVEENVSGILATIKELKADILLIQEVDIKSKRSYYINQQEKISEQENMAYASALNFKCEYVPYPIPTIGKVSSGLATYSSYEMSEATREKLPGTFSWPVSIAHLKRCLLVSRFPLSNGKNLVLVNLHLEAFDSGEGRLAQTRALLKIIEDEYAKGNFVIAGGDFNQTFPNSRPEAFAFQEGRWHPGTLTQDMIPQGWSYASDDSEPTCRASHTVYTPALENEEIKKNWQYYLLDGFILSPNVELKTAKSINKDFLHSDHNPVYIEVVLKN